MKKILVTISIAAILLSSGMYANAETQTLTDNGIADIGVNATITPMFEVTLPNTIDITERQVKEFEVTAKSQPKRSETLEITMPATITMTNNDQNIDLALAMDKKSFYYDELILPEGTTTKCRIDASTLPSGDWVGNLSVDIQLKDFELPEGLSLKPLVIAYRDSSNKCHIVSFESSIPLTYKESNGYIGYNGDSLGSAIQYHEDANGVYQGGTLDRVWDTVIPVSSVDLIYSNYDIKYSDRDEIFFAKTVFE